MEIQKIFSEIDTDERIYSVLMSEDELALFSEIQKEFGDVKKANKALKKAWERANAKNVLVGPKTVGRLREINQSGSTLTKHERKAGLPVRIHDDGKRVIEANLYPNTPTNHSINLKGINQYMGKQSYGPKSIMQDIHNDPEKGAFTRFRWSLE